MKKHFNRHPIKLEKIYFRKGKNIISENFSLFLKKYNINAQEIYKLLKKDKANCINVPYKFNRAVLFNSDYFHETDKINFKDSYEARRINITYLFGDRLFKKKTK